MSLTTATTVKLREVNLTILVEVTMKSSGAIHSLILILGIESFNHLINHSIKFTSCCKWLHLQEDLIETLP